MSTGKFLKCLLNKRNRNEHFNISKLHGNIAQWQSTCLAAQNNAFKIQHQPEQQKVTCNYSGKYIPQYFLKSPTYGSDTRESIHWQQGGCTCNLLELSNEGENYQEQEQHWEGRKTTPRVVSLLQLGSFNYQQLTGSSAATWESRKRYGDLNKLGCNKEEYFCVPVSQS